MPTFSYLARDQRGRAVTGTMGAQTPEALADELKRMGYLVTRFREVRPDAGPRLVAPWRRVRPDDLVLLNVQLAKMVQVGIPLVTALETLQQQTGQPVLRAALGDVARSVQSGASFSEALVRHPQLFSPLYISLIRAGEISGRLDEILARLAEFAQQQSELREQLKTALTYPTLLVVAGVAIMTFLVTVVIPQFMRIFLEANVPLPAPTLLLHSLSVLLRSHGLVLAAGLAAAAWGLRALVRTPWGRRRWDSFILAIPAIGPIVQRTLLARFSRTFATLAASGVPIVEALKILEEASGNVILADAVRAVQRSVQRGGTIAESLRASRLFPPMAVQMVLVGETSGTLDHMLAQLAEHYDQMVRYGLKRATSLVEPLFLALMGGLVAFIMSSILLPMFKLVQVVH